MAVAHVGAFVVGMALVILTLRSSIRTFVLPRSINDSLTRAVFRAIHRLFLLFAPPARAYEERDRIMALFAPVALLSLPVVWIAIVTTGYAGMFWASGARDAQASFTISASSMVTLGFDAPHGLLQTFLAFSQASVGLGLVALLIAYLPTIYGAFSRRELAVNMLEVRAGSPPSAVTLITRFQRLEKLERLEAFWEGWEVWFAELDETHTSIGSLALFRSPLPQHSWITATGAVLDAAALRCSVVALPREPQAELTLRAGYLAVRHIADFFKLRYEADVDWRSPISVARQQFDEACASLAEAGVPLKDDRDQAWKDFVGWRANYDGALLSLAALTIAPSAPWLSAHARGAPPIAARDGAKRSDNLE